MEIAYRSDVIVLNKDIGKIPSGSILEVDGRLSDLGGVICTLQNYDSGIYAKDGDYSILEYNNVNHKKIKLEEYLSKSNDSLLSNFKWGSEGAGEFSKFMRLVRDLYENS